MSDVEEPPTKMSKYEAEEYLEEAEEEILEEGQEEWLSEGVLTDEDYHIPESDKNSQNLDESEKLDQVATPELDVSDQNSQEKVDPSEMLGNIEDTLNTFDSSKTGLSDDMNTYLISKTDAKSIESSLKDENQEEDDGNDTDDLLRMLGEDDQGMKNKALKVVKLERNDDQGSTDDEFVYEQSKVKTLKLAKNALIKRTPVKAVPEDMSEGDDESEQSSDEGSTVERMFALKKTQRSQPTQKKVMKHIVKIENGSVKNEKPGPKTMKLLQNNNSKDSLSNKPVLKSVEIKTPAPFTPLTHPSSKVKQDVKDEFDDLIDEEEFLEEDLDLDDEEFLNGEGEDSRKQRIMKPERMDEEVPSDGESRSEDGSLYDELPSSDSDDMDDWFTLDLRAERASDYLPLLGSKARSQLAAERRRVSARVATLQHSLSALTRSARRQASALRAAAAALAELDDTLRAC